MRLAHFRMMREWSRARAGRIVMYGIAPVLFWLHRFCISSWMRNLPGDGVWGGVWTDLQTAAALLLGGRWVDKKKKKKGNKKSEEWCTGQCVKESSSSYCSDSSSCQIRLCFVGVCCEIVAGWLDFTGLLTAHVTQYWNIYSVELTPAVLNEHLQLF